LGLMKLFLKIDERLLIEHRLLLGQAAIDPHLGLLGQVRRDAWIGLETAQNVWAHQAPQGGERRGVFAFTQSFDKPLELGRRTQEAGTAKIKKRPQIAQVIFDGRAREYDAAVGPELLDAARLIRAGILDGLCLVQNDERPGDTLKPVLAANQR